MVSFPNLGSDDLIIPGSARLTFNITLQSTDPNRTIVNNLGRSIVQKMVIKISGKEVMSIDRSDVYHCYLDQWKSREERGNSHYQGIDTTPLRNATRLRIGAAHAMSNAHEDAIAEAYGNRFFILLDFELLKSHAPFCQSAFRGRLEYHLHTSSPDRVIQATDPKATY